MAGPWRVPSKSDPYWIQHWRDVAAKLREWAAQNRAHFGGLADGVADIQERNAAAFERKADALESKLTAAGEGARGRGGEGARGRGGEGASNGNPDSNR